MLDTRPVRSHLVHALVQLDREHTAAAPEERWEDWYPLGSPIASPDHRVRVTR